MKSRETNYGKGDSPRVSNYKKYRDKYDLIDFKTNKPKTGKP